MIKRSFVFLTLFLLNICLASAQVTVTTAQEGTEHRVIFRGGKFPYVLRMWESKVGPTHTYRGLGLRGTWFEKQMSNAWYMNSFLDISINGKRVIGEPDLCLQYPEKIDRFDVMESSGKRALVRYVWERDAASAQLKFMTVPESRALLAELTIEPKQEIKSIELRSTCFPGKYTTQHEGDRRMHTAMREEKAVTTVTADPARENWFLFCDAKYDIGNPEYGAMQLNGCAGLYIRPEDFETVSIKIENYPVSITMIPRKGKTRIRLAFDELGMPNAKALATIKESAPVVQRILAEDSFLPAGMAESTVSTLLAENEKPVSKETAAFNAFQEENRLRVQAERKLSSSIRLLEVRGLGYSKYRTAEAAEKIGKAEITGSYLTVTGQGKNISYFPGTAEEMYRFDAVLLLDVDPLSLSPQQVDLLKDFVATGGGLILSGGFYGYNGLRNSPLAEILPFELDYEAFGLSLSGEALRLESDELKTPPRIPDNIVAPWLHKADAKKDAKILIKNGSRPWAAVWKVGKGRVLACAGNVFGTSAEGTVLFHEWEGWPELWASLIKTVLTRQ